MTKDVYTERRTSNNSKMKTKEPAVFPMQKHTIFINLIAEKIKAKSYLEIGVYNPDHNFNRINVEEKTSIDPDENAKAGFKMTSDEFFAANWIKLEDEENERPLLRFDIGFVDGLHHADQVRKDLTNLWQCLNDKGVIIIHDTNPHSESITHVPRNQREWSGDVYKTICQIEQPDFFTLKDDYGVTVIRKTGELKLNDDVVTWDEFDRFRDKILSLKTWDECIKIIDGWK